MDSAYVFVKINNQVTNGLVTSSTTLSFTHTITNKGNFNILVSFDGITWTSSSFTIEVFDFPSSIAFSYSSNVYNENGCSIYGFNNMFFNISSILTTKTFTPYLKIRDSQFERIVPCSWSTTLICQCVDLWDLSVNLPSSYSFSFQFNGVDWYNSETFGSQTILYFLPSKT
jgi:hypothetical protein